jgi:hypothetical protein
MKGIGHNTSPVRIVLWILVDAAAVALVIKASDG